MLNEDERDDLITIFAIAYSLKRLLRQGWIRSGVPTCSIENIASHSCAAAMMSYFLATLEQQSDPSIDPYRVATLTLFHDFLEGMYLDLDRSIEEITSKNEAKKIKRALEDGARRQLLGNIRSDTIKNALKHILMETNVKERTLVHIADKLDLVLQAQDYYSRGLLSESERQKYFRSFEAIINLGALTTVKHLLDALCSSILNEELE